MVTWSAGVVSADRGSNRDQHSRRVPRVVIAAPASGSGKTTVATGVMAALADTGLAVSGHKVGPDYIDPSYHALATGRPGRNLDPYLQAVERVVPLFLHGSAGADIAVVEGVMGLFDGALGSAGFASTAHVARLLDAPVVLVIDASAAGRSVAAMVHGFATFDPQVRLAGVILNKLGSQRHEIELRSALEPLDIPVLGALQRTDGVHAPSRHLGLVPVAERRRAAERMLDQLRAWVRSGIDLDALVRVARHAGPLAGSPWDPAEELTLAAGRPEPAADGLSPASRPVVATAAGEAFTFGYTENIELLRAAGADIVDIDPLADAELPPGCAGLSFGGGFPEVHADALAANAPLRGQVAAAAARGVPIVAECGGLTYLCRSLDGQPMAGVLDGTAVMTSRRTLGYRTATAATGSVLADAGTAVAGHEFHRTVVTPEHGTHPAWQFGDGRREGFVTGSVHASYLHLHWAGRPQLAREFVTRAARVVPEVPA